MKKYIWFAIVSLSLFLFSLGQLSAYTQAISDDRVFIASERIILLMKNEPRRYNYEIIIRTLISLQEQVNWNRDQLLQEIQDIISTFDTCRTAWWEWKTTHHECEYIEKDTCEDVLWWIFTECASACRHMWDRICTLECIPVCSFN